MASWYLRLRAATGHDPLWGLVRVEIAAPAARTSTKKLGERADEVSCWILAEALPLAVPDGRWDKMVYPIRDCEEFLRAGVRAFTDGTDVLHAPVRDGADGADRHGIQRECGHRAARIVVDAHHGSGCVRW